MKNISKAVFLGSKKFGLEIFKALYGSSTKVEWKILCPPDRDDKRTHYDEFVNFAKLENLDLSTADSPDMVVQYASDYKPDLLFVCGYYRILPNELFDHIGEGVWGIHNSLLPKYRGGSPLVWQMINSEEHLGSSLFRFSSGMDDGPVLHQIKIRNLRTLTIGTATDAIEKAWISELPDVWRNYCEEELEPAEQDHALATYCAQRQDEDGLIDWTKSASYIDSFIRAQDKPYPMAYFTLEGKKVRVVSHEYDNRVVYGRCGQVFEAKEEYVSVCCGGNSLLRILEVELEGAARRASDVIRSFKLRL